MAQRTVQRLGPGAFIFSVGTGTLTVASNIVTLNSNAADQTNVIYVPLNLPAEQPLAFDQKIGKIDVEYVITIADLDAAPTAVLSRVTMSETTGVRSRATETITTAFVGTNTTGLAVGTYVMTVTPSSLAHQENNEELWLEITMNAAATTVIKIGGGRIWIAPV